MPEAARAWYQRVSVSSAFLAAAGLVTAPVCRGDSSFAAIDNGSREVGQACSMRREKQEEL